MSSWPAPTESTATTYWSFGRFCWSCTCTTRSFRSSSFSSFCVATTLPTTLPINMLGSFPLEVGDDVRGRERAVDEASARLAGDVADHRLPAGRRTPPAEPE